MKLPSKRLWSRNYPHSFSDGDGVREQISPQFRWNSITILSCGHVFSWDVVPSCQLVLPRTVCSCTNLFCFPINLTIYSTVYIPNFMPLGTSFPQDCYVVEKKNNICGWGTARCIKRKAWRWNERSNKCSVRDFWRMRPKKSNSTGTGMELWGLGITRNHFP